MPRGSSDFRHGPAPALDPTAIAYRAGIREGSVVWSYDGQRVFHPRELAKLSTTGRRGETVEVVIVTRDGPERFFVERDPLGA